MGISLKSVNGNPKGRVCKCDIIGCSEKIQGTDLSLSDFIDYMKRYGWRGIKIGAEKEWLCPEHAQQYLKETPRRKS